MHIDNYTAQYITRKATKNAKIAKMTEFWCFKAYLHHCVTIATHSVGWNCYREMLAYGPNLQIHNADMPTLLYICHQTIHYKPCLISTDG